VVQEAILAKENIRVCCSWDIDLKIITKVAKWLAYKEFLFPKIYTAIKISSTPLICGVLNI